MTGVPVLAAVVFALTCLVLGPGGLPQAGDRARVGFWEYARVGAPVTLLTPAWGVWWLRG